MIEIAKTLNKQNIFISSFLVNIRECYFYKGCSEFYHIYSKAIKSVEQYKKISNFKPLSLQLLSFKSLAKHLTLDMTNFLSFIWSKLNNIKFCEEKCCRISYSFMSYLLIAIMFYDLDHDELLHNPPQTSLNLTCAEILKSSSLLNQILYHCDMALIIGSNPNLALENKNVFQIIANNLVVQLNINNSFEALSQNKMDNLIDLLKITENNNYEHEDILFPCPRIACPTISQFTRIANEAQPIVITESIDEWPCFGGQNKWDIPYLLEKCGPRWVPVEIGRKFTDSDWRQEFMPFSKFVENYVLKPGGNKASPHLKGGGDVLGGYLAQHYIFDQIPELKEDFDIPIYCYSSGGGGDGGSLFPPKSENNNIVDINCWFGPAGTVSPLHHDPKSNLLCQIFGTKYVRLYDPRHSTALYHDPRVSNNTSPIHDIYDPNLATEFPRFFDAPYTETLLCPGEMLFIPAKYWHYVKSLAPSFSINFWW